MKKKPGLSLQETEAEVLLALMHDPCTCSCLKAEAQEARGRGRPVQPSLRSTILEIFRSVL